MKKNYLLAIFVCALWGTAFVFAKIALKYNTPFLIAGERFILSGIILIPFSGGFRALSNYIKNNIKLILIISFFQTILLYGIFFSALKVVAGAQAAIIIGSSSLVSAIVSHVMQKDDKLTFYKLASLFIGVIGIIVISLSTKPWQSGGIMQFVGIIALLIGSIASAVGNVLVAKNKSKIDAPKMTAAQIFIGGVVLLMIGFLKEGIPKIDLGWAYYGALIWLSSISALGFTVWFYLLKKITVSKLNIWKFLIPLVGATSSWIIIPDESPTSIAIIGMILTIGSIIIFYSVGDKKIKI